MSHSIWRRRLWLWLPALLFFLLNVAAYGIYRTSYADQTAGLESRIATREGELASLSERRAELEALVTQARLNKEQIEELYSERFSTRRRRLTRMTAEIRELAGQAGLEPKNISYPEEEVDDYSLIERSFVFSVEGSYQQLRRFVNFLELSPSFLALRRVTLNGMAGGSETEVRMSLTMSTLFTQDGAVPPLQGVSQ